MLSVQPTRVNKGLTDAAKALQFAALVEAMRKVFDCLHGADVDAAKLEEFQAGLDALAGLEKGFTPLVAMHDRWQLVESDLVLFDSTLSRYKDAGAAANVDYDELEVACQSLRSKIEPLCRASTESWAAEHRALQRTIRSCAGRSRFHPLALSVSLFPARCARPLRPGG